MCMGTCKYEDKNGECSLFAMMDKPEDAYCNILPVPTNDNKYRKVVRIEDGGNDIKFNAVEFTDLKKGDIFMMFEPDGELVMSPSNEGIDDFTCIYLATSDVRYMDGNPVIDVDDGTQAAYDMITRR